MGRHGRRQRIILQDLCDRSALAPGIVLQEMSVHYKLPIVDLDAAEKDPAAMCLVPFETAKHYGIFPLKISDGALTIAVSDPTDFFTLDDLRLLSGYPIKRALNSAAEIHAAIEKYYHLDGFLQKAVEELSVSGEKDRASDYKSALSALEDYHSPVSKTVQRILENAIQLNASDIHFEPREKEVELRYRIDGELVTVQSLPSQHYPALVARIKILSQMDIAEQRKPQDGRAHLLFRGRKIDLRISTLLTLFGEKVAIRLLNQESLAVDSLDDLGFSPAQREAYLKAISSRQGMVLITGPTGSGKTTTLYTSLNYIKSGKHNITTIEDPIEYRLSGINQSQINSKIGITFASMLRSILRQDPDVILVGEIRDRETADIAFRSSMTGHLVFSTLHTNSSLATMTRLHDLGLEPYLIGPALLCVVAQRLVRAICPGCRESYRPDPEVRTLFKDYLPHNHAPVFYRGRGCKKCSQTGIRGRIAVFEVLPILDELRTAICARVPEDVLYRKARRLGFKTMAESAVEKTLEGVTPAEEVLPFLPAYEREEGDLLTALADYIDTNRKNRLLVVKNEDLVQKILLHAKPEDYALIEPVREPKISDNLPLLPAETTKHSKRT